MTKTNNFLFSNDKSKHKDRVIFIFYTAVRKIFEYVKVLNSTA